MSAIITNTKRALTALLCAILVFSLTPGFTSSAFAAEDPNAVLDGFVDNTPDPGSLPVGDDGTYGFSGGSGSASTQVDIVVFDGKLRTEATDSFAATREQILAEDSVFSKLQVNASCSYGKDADDYSFSWRIVKDNEEFDIDLSDYVSDIVYYDNIAHCMLDLAALVAANDGFTDGSLYRFICDVTCGPEAASETIEIATIDQQTSYKDIRRDATSGNGYAAIAYGGFHTGAKLLAGPVSAQNESFVRGSFTTAAANPPTNLSDAEGGYLVGDITSAQVTGTFTFNGQLFPAYLGDELILLIPVDNGIEKNSYTGEPLYDYKVGDTIYVLNMGSEETEAEWYEAIIVEDNETYEGEGGLKAKVTIGADDQPVMPGFFALAYAPDKRDPDVPPVTYYTVTVNDMPEGGGISAQGADVPVGTWEVGKDAVYNLAPASQVVMEDGSIFTYEVENISFVSGDVDVYVLDTRNVMNDGVFAEGLEVDGVTFAWDGVNNNLTIIGAAEGAYSMRVTFKEIFTQAPDAFENAPIHVAVVMDDGSTNVGSANVNVSYYEYTEGMSVLPDRTDISISGTSNELLNTVAGYETSMQALDGASGEDDIVLSEVWTGTSFDDMTKDETFTRHKTFKEGAYVKFVYKVDDSGRVPTFTRTATVIIDETGHGAISAGDDELVLSTTRTYLQSLPGAAVTFVGDDGWYAAWADVYKTDPDAPGGLGEQIHRTWLLNNVHEEQIFDWTAYANHGEFDVTFVVHFSPITDVSRYSLEIVDSEYGRLVPCGWTESEDGMYAVRTTLPLKVKAASGYRIANNRVLVYHSDDDSVPPVSVPVIGGVAAFTMPAFNARVEAEFVVAPMPFDDIAYDLNIYVAGDPSAMTDTAYAMDTDGVTVIPSVNEKKVSLYGYEAKGSVFGSTAIHTSVNASTVTGYPSYDMSLLADDGARIEKVYVVKYNEADGVKTVQSATLYYTAMPTFTLDNIDSNTDVVVYFVDKSTDDRKPDPEIPDLEWTDVIVSVNNGTQLYPNTTIPVIVGSDLTNTFAPFPGYMWGTIEVDGSPVWTPVGSSDAYEYVLEDVRGSEHVIVNFIETDDDIERPLKVSASNGRGGSIDASQGSVSITDASNMSVPVGRFGVPMAFDSAFQVNVKGTTTYVVSDLMFTWTDENTVAYIDHDAQVIYFMAADAEVSGLVSYTSGSSMKGMFPEGRFVDWNVSGLRCDIDIVPMFVGGKTPSDIDDDDYYTVTAKVKSGIGSITNDVQTGWPIKVAKSEDTLSLRVDFTGFGAYEVEHVSVKKRTDALTGIWEAFVGLFTGGTAAQKYEEQAIQNGWISLDVDADYDIEVDFIDPDASVQSDDRVAVNILSDPLRGNVSPASVVFLNKSGSDTTQKYIVDLKSAENGKRYSIKDVKVSYTPNGASSVVTSTVIPHLNSMDGSVVWDERYYNVFTFDAEKFALVNTNVNAVTIIVEYSDGADLDPDDEELLPDGRMKFVQISAVVDGKPVVGDNNKGGVISPYGEFNMEIEQGANGAYTTQKVDVACSSAYEIASVTVDGVENAAYMRSIADNGCFYVASGPAKSENIIVLFKQKSVAEANYSIEVSTVGNGTTVPSGAVLVPVDESRYYSLYPNTKGIGVINVKDQYKDADGNIHDFAPGTPTCAYTRAEKDTSVFSGIMVEPVTVSGKVVDRFITVTFGSMESYGGKGNETYIDDDPTVNIKVNVWGNARDALIAGITPCGNMLGVQKKKGVAYGYTFIIPASEVLQGAYVYAIDVNGVRYWGDKESKLTRAASGSIVLRYNDIVDDLSRTDNTIDIYTQYFNGSMVGAKGIIYSAAGPGGVIFEYDGAGTMMQGRSYNGASDLTDTVSKASHKSVAYTVRNPENSEFGGFGMQSWGGGTGDANNGSSVTPSEFYMVPDSGSTNYVIDEVHLKNCDVVAFAWMYPRNVPGYETDTRDSKCALKYVLKLHDESKSGFVLVTYRGLKAGESADDVSKNWDEGKVVEKEDLNALNYTMRIQVTPDDAVDRLTSAADKMHDELFITPIGNLWVNGVSEHQLLDGSWDAVFDTVDPDKFVINKDGSYAFEVGDLLKWNALDPESGALYTVDVDNLPANVTATPLIDTKAVEAAKNYIGGQAGDSTKDPYYKRYIIKGKVSDLVRSGTELLLKLPLKAIPYEEGYFPEFATTLPGNGSDHTVTVRVNNPSYGTVKPVEFDGDEWFNGSRSADVFAVKDGTQVAFMVEPKDGYRLYSLRRNDGAINCVANGEYSIALKRVAFAVTSDTELVAEFKSEADARVPITVQISGAGGTTEPAAGRTYDCPVGDPFTLMLNPDTQQGFIPSTVDVLVNGQVVETNNLGSTQRIFTLPATYTWQPVTLVVTFKLDSGIILSATGMPEPTPVGASTWLSQTGDVVWPILAVTVMAILGLAGIKVSRQRARQDIYRVTKR